MESKALELRCQPVENHSGLLLEDMSEQELAHYTDLSSELKREYSRTRLVRTR